MTRKSKDLMWGNKRTAHTTMMTNFCPLLCNSLTNSGKPLKFTGSIIPLLFLNPSPASHCTLIRPQILQHSQNVVCELTPCTLARVFSSHCTFSLCHSREPTGSYHLLFSLWRTLFQKIFSKLPCWHHSSLSSDIRDLS